MAQQRVRQLFQEYQQKIREDAEFHASELAKFKYLDAMWRGMGQSELARHADYVTSRMMFDDEFKQKAVITVQNLMLNESDFTMFNTTSLANAAATLDPILFSAFRKRFENAHSRWCTIM